MPPREAGSPSTRGGHGFGVHAVSSGALCGVGFRFPLTQPCPARWSNRGKTETHMAKKKREEEHDDAERSAPLMETDDWIDADEERAFEQAMEKKGNLNPKANEKK